MAKVLLTGGSGFIAAHILRILLERGYTVITTVRSQAKGDQLIKAQTESFKSKLSYAIVGDIAQRDAFNAVVRSNPDLDYVIHTASPFLAKFEDPILDVLEPAINGTVGILKAIDEYAPQVKRVVITSSFAAIVNTESPPKAYDESSWNPVTWDESLSDKSKTYRGSKVSKGLSNFYKALQFLIIPRPMQTFAEKAAWGFLDKEKPSFDITTINPPLVYGPIAHHLENLDRLNTSNLNIRDIIQGKYKDNPLPPTGTFLFTDVRDLALAHVRAIEVPEAGGKRFFVVAGHCSHKQIVDGLRKTI
uniref:NAD-dependent epimerase/dehydratase domain-containing protein n=1 Tax=Bionectria ochroleuca TaxID=29856 RepID=A0A8H7KDT0_BIOOC